MATATKSPPQTPTPDHLLTCAEAEIQAGDLDQAARTLIDAANRAVDEFAEERGLHTADDPRSRRDIVEIVYHETYDFDIFRRYSSVGILEFHLGCNCHDADELRRHAGKIRDFIRRIDARRHP